MTTRPRPLSPHLTVYRWTLTMAMSIVHRATGVALYAGTILLVLWLLSAAIGGGFYEGFRWFFSTWLGQFILFGYTWALFHHMVGGLRYFVWDRATWMTHPEREWLAWANLIVPVVLTLLAWSLAVWFR